MPIENKLDILMEDAENLDIDLLEEVRQKVSQEVKSLEEAKGKDEKEETDEKGQEAADEQDADPAVKIDNPINPDLNGSDTDGDGVDDEEEAEEQQQQQEEVAAPAVPVVEQKSMKQSVEELLGDEFSEDFKLQAVTIFEAAVKEQVVKIENALKAEYAQKAASLQEDFDSKLVAETSKIEEDLSEEINGYLTIMSEEWMRKNELAVHAGIKAELVESFIDGMKTLFEEHYVDLPEEKLDIVGKLEEEKQSLESNLNASAVALTEMTEKYNAVVRDQIIAESAKDFTSLDFERFKVLTEDFDFENETTFRKKVEIVKKAFFETKAERIQKKESLSESFIPSQEIVEESTIDVDAQPSSMSAYLKYLNKK